MSARIAVVIGTYNNAAHVEATIASVRRQDRSDWWCLAVDNGSLDDTAARTRLLVADDPRFALACKSNEGPRPAATSPWHDCRPASSSCISSTGTTCCGRPS